MQKTIGWFFLLAVGGLLIVSAFCMAVSPRTWFQLSERLGITGTLSPERYASGKGSIEVRALGAVVLAGIGWVIYDYLCR